MTKGSLKAHRNLLLLVLPLALCALATASEPSAVTDKTAYETVRTTESFAIGRVGVAGIISKQENAFRELLHQPDALAQCQKLLAEGTPAGQLYGLLGLRLLDESAFDAALPRYTASKSVIETVNGCMISHTTAAAVAGRIAKGDVK